MAGIPLFSIKALTEGSGGGGSGLPPVSGSGKALVSINGQWVEQDGYGYTTTGTQTTIEWDGNPEGHYTIELGEFKLSKVSDETPTSASLIGGSVTENRGDTSEITEAWIVDLGDGIYAIGDGHVIVALHDNAYASYLGATFEQKGIYFSWVPYDSLDSFFISSLTYKTEDAIHKIDPKYLPATVFITEIRDINDAAYTHECDKSLSEIHSALENGQVVLAKYYDNTFFCVFCDGDEAHFVGWDIYSDPSLMIFRAFDEGPSPKGAIENIPLPPAGGNPGDVLTMGHWGPEWRGGKNYDIVSVSSLTNWNQTLRLGSATPNITLPRPSLQVDEEIRIVFIAASANATFTAPSGFILGDDDGYAGLSAGNSVTYTDLTVGSIYEVSIAVLDSTYLKLLMQESKVE